MKRKITKAQQRAAINRNADTCIENMMCPECGQYDAFNITVTVQVEMLRSGTAEFFGDTEYEDHSYCQCPECGHSGTVGMFTVTHKAVSVGRCTVCRHYGDDCTGTRP
jgi:hypothetical protein